MNVVLDFLTNAMRKSVWRALAVLQCTLSSRYSGPQTILVSSVMKLHFSRLMGDGDVRQSTDV